MKPFRTTLFLAVTAALLGTYIWTWEREDDRVRAERDAAREAFRFDPREVSAVELRQSSGVLRCERGPDGGWRIAAPIDARADADAVERLLQDLRDLPPANLVLPDHDGASAAYGLDPPRARIVLERDGAPPLILSIGARTPLGDGVFARSDAHPAIVRVPDTLPDRLPSSPYALRDRALLRSDPASIDRIDLRTPTGSLQLARDSSGVWHLHQPVAGRADSATVATLLETVLGCEIVQFVQDGARDLAPYGLDNLSAVTIALGSADGTGSRVLSVGDPLPSALTLVYARVQGEDSVYAVPDTLRQALLLRVDDLRDRRVPGLGDISAIAAFRIEEGPRRLEARRTENGGWELLAPLAMPADAESIEELLRGWSEVRVAGLPPAGVAGPDAWPRTLRLEFADGGRPARSYRLAPVPDGIPSPDGAVWLASGDDMPLAFAAPDALLAAPLAPEPYLSREAFALDETDLAEIRFIPPGGTAIRYLRDADGVWTPPSPALGEVLGILSPLRVLRHEAGLVPPEPAAVLELRFRGRDTLAAELRIAVEPAPDGSHAAAFRGSPRGFWLDSATAATLLSLVPPSPAP